MAVISSFAGLFEARAYAYGITPNAPAALQVVAGSATSGAYTLTCASSPIANHDGAAPVPTTTTPITVGTGSNIETVTPSAVSVDGFGNYLITATYANAHAAGEQVRSGTVGLQEALNAASTNGGGSVIVDAKWAAFGGTTAMISAATTPSGVQIFDNRTGVTSVSSTVLTKTVTIANAAMLTLHSVPVKLVDAPGAGDIIEVTNLAINFIFDTSAPTGGGALSAGYDTTASPAATATIAATLVTSAAANTFGMSAGVVVAGASSGMINKGLYLIAAGADFTNGASGHGSMVVTVNYRVLTSQV